ncbi:MAG: YceI family protein [Weeksellaceae bacterium]|nr:YceI family protein [Weeksellaceae bacterium]
MKKIFLGLTVAGMIVISSCGKSADTLATEDAQEVLAASEDAESFVVDTNESSTTWRGFKFFQDATKPEEGHFGIIKLKEGVLSVKDGMLESGKLISDQSTIENHDVEDQGQKSDLVNHLKSPDFLNIEEFPHATFEISKVNPLAEGDYNTEISGNLDFRGVPKNITFKANVKVEGDKLSIQSEEFTINRQEFGVDFAPGNDTVIKDEVVLQLDIKADREA